MRLHIAYSLPQSDWLVAGMVRRLAEKKGIAVELSSQQVVGSGGGIYNLNLLRADFVLAIAAKHSRSLANTRNEIIYAKGMGTPVLGLFEKGVSIPPDVRQGITYVTFDRRNIEPAARRLSNIRAEKKGQKDGDNWRTAGIMAIVALGLLWEKD